jgi:hypothetical protein
MAQFNTTYSDSIISRFVVTLGDEFQVLLKDAPALFGIRQAFNMQPLPFSMRLGVGVGTISTDLKKDALGMDGPAFHRARKAVEWLKEHGGLMHVDTGNEIDNDSLNSIAELCEAVRVGWTQRQHEVYTHIYRSTTQRQMASEFQISPSAISRMLSRMHVKEIAQGEATIIRILDNLLAEDNLT